MYIACHDNISTSQTFVHPAWLKIYRRQERVRILHNHNETFKIKHKLTRYVLIEKEKQRLFIPLKQYINSQSHTSLQLFKTSKK